MSGARFNYGLWKQPDYNPYGTVFTERQNAIINGEHVDYLRNRKLPKSCEKPIK